jgi:hypothetical protein
MSYEAHVTMAINCITTSVYVYAVFELIAVCLAIIIAAAKTVPPIDLCSMLFNLWFSIVTMAMVVFMRPVLVALFFPHGFAKPTCEISVARKDKGIMTLSTFGTAREVSTIAGYFVHANIDASTKTAGSEPVKVPEALKSPGTPNSLAEERSQADTETDLAAKCEIKPCF